MMLSYKTILLPGFGLSLVTLSGIPSQQDCSYCPETILVKGGVLITDQQDSLHLTDYYIGKYEVTQAQWVAVMGTNPSKHQGCNDCPVEQVSWDDANTYLRRLNKLSGKSYRLPFEAEWEYAATGGRFTRHLQYAGSNDLDQVAWHGENAGHQTHPVGTKKPNELGLYDFSGNVWEWCADIYRGGRTQNGMLRGGAWTSWENYCTPHFRNDYYSRQHACETDGFRVAHPVMIDL